MISLRTDLDIMLLSETTAKVDGQSEISGRIYVFQKNKNINHSTERIHSSILSES